jgi:hypothetical protein
MMNQVSTTADPDRQFVIESSWQQHFGKPKYFSSWHAGFLFISLNTVNPHGGWDGSLDLNQLKWLEALLNENPQTPVILLSHHPLSTLNNGWAPLGSDARVTGEQFESFLSNFSNIVAWFAGHEHRNSVTRVGGANGFWLIETCSLIDWPQEGRIVEFFIRDENLLISLSMFQHDSPDSVIADQALIENLELEDTGTLASISRELSANDWQRQSGESSIHNLRGSDRDRTVVLQHPMRGLRL